MKAPRNTVLMVFNQFQISKQGAGEGGGCFSFEGTVQYIEESNIYLCFVVCRLKRGLVT